MFVACGIWCLADVSSVSPSSERAVGSDEGLTLETSAKHHIPHATNIPYQLLLIKPIYMCKWASFTQTQLSIYTHKQFLPSRLYAAFIKFKMQVLKFIPITELICQWANFTIHVLGMEFKTTLNILFFFDQSYVCLFEYSVSSTINILISKSKIQLMAGAAIGNVSFILSIRTFLRPSLTI